MLVGRVTVDTVSPVELPDYISACVGSLLCFLAVRFMIALYGNGGGGNDDGQGDGDVWARVRESVSVVTVVSVLGVALPLCSGYWLQLAVLDVIAVDVDQCAVHSWLEIYLFGAVWILSWFPSPDRRLWPQVQNQLTQVCRPCLLFSLLTYVDVCGWSACD